jgi:hypothetical protein
MEFQKGERVFLNFETGGVEKTDLELNLRLSLQRCPHSISSAISSSATRLRQLLQ